MPIFIVGNARSGTTMMGCILGNHPAVYTVMNELHFFDKLWSPAATDRKLSGEETIQLAAKLLNIQANSIFFQEDTDKFQERARQIVQHLPGTQFSAVEVYAHFLHAVTAEREKRISCEQTPQYIYYLQDILSLFPDAKVIHMLRDPRDVLLSMKNKWQGRFLNKKQSNLKNSFHLWVHYHPIFTSRFWQTAIEKAERLSDDPRVYVVRFEDVLKFPDKTVTKICAFLGLKYHPDMLNVPIVSSSFIPEDPANAKIDPTRAENWKKGGLNSAELFINQIITGRLMQKFGYKPVKVFPNPFLFLWYLCSLPVKACLSFLSQIRDFSNIRDAVKRRL